MVRFWLGSEVEEAMFGSGLVKGGGRGFKKVIGEEKEEFEGPHGSV